MVFAAVSVTCVIVGSLAIVIVPAPGVIVIPFPAVSVALTGATPIEPMSNSPLPGAAVVVNTPPVPENKKELAVKPVPVIVLKRPVLAVVAPMLVLLIVLAAVGFIVNAPPGFIVNAPPGFIVTVPVPVGLIEELRFAPFTVN